MTLRSFKGHIFVWDYDQVSRNGYTEPCVCVQCAYGNGCARRGGRSRKGVTDTLCLWVCLRKFVRAVRVRVAFAVCDWKTKCVFSFPHCC